MSSQHKRPLFAFVMVAVACAVIMSYSWRAQALIDIIARGDVPALIQVGERAVLGGMQTSTIGGDESSVAAPGPSAPDLVHKSSGPEPSETARPRPRPAPGPGASHAWAKQQQVARPHGTQSQHQPQSETPGAEKPGVVPPRLPEASAPPKAARELPAEVLRRLTERLSRLPGPGHSRGQHGSGPPGLSRGHDTSNHSGTARGHRKGYLDRGKAQGQRESRHRGRGHGHRHGHR